MASSAVGAPGAGSTRATVSRASAAAVVGWGVGLLAAPARVRDAVLPGDPTLRPWVVRVLGARLVAQHGLVARWPAVGVLVRGSAAIDAAHAAVMVVLAVRGGPHRAATSLSAVMAATAAAVAWGSRPR